MSVELGANLTHGPVDGLVYAKGAEIPFVSGTWILTPDDMG
jgi:hypothetical protein